MELKAPRTCARCGQDVDPLKDSWTTDAGRMRHTTCPTSAALRDLPAVAEAHTEAGQPRPQFLTITEAAEILRVDDSTIRRYIKSRKLPAKKLPGAANSPVRILESDLLGLLEDAV